MKKILIPLSLLLAVLITVGWSYFHKSKVIVGGHKNILVVGTNASFPPFEYIENGKIVGFEIELVNAIGKYLGKEIVFKDMEFDSLLVEAQSGRIHVIAAGMTPTLERSKKVFFAKPYLENDPLIIITFASKSPKSVADLQGKEVIVNDGYTAESYMKKQEGINLKCLATPAEAFFAIANGRAYAYVSARSAVQPFFDRYGQDKFSILTLPISDSYALAVPKTFPEVFESVQKALIALEHNGTLEHLKKKWHLTT